MKFVIDFLATGILLLTLVIAGCIKHFLFSTPQIPSLSFSKLKDLQHLSWRNKIDFLPQLLRLLSLILLILAFIDPHLLFKHKNEAISSGKKIQANGIALYLVLDRSGSMGQPVDKTRAEKKIDLLQRVTKEFIVEHPSDLIGMIAFARVPQVLAPLTLDQLALLKQLDQLKIAASPEEDGTALGYAIYKAANILAATKEIANDPHQKTPYTIKSTAIIAVTDGFQDPSHLDRGNRLRSMELDDAGNFAKKHGIRLYIINIDPALAVEKFAPERRQLQKLTAMTGGHYYFADETLRLQDIYEAISHLEKGTIAQESIHPKKPKASYTSRFSFFHYFLMGGMILFLLSFLLEYAFLRRIP